MSGELDPEGLRERYLEPALERERDRERPREMLLPGLDAALLA